MTTAPAPPADLAESGRALWVDVTAKYELEAHESQLLHEMCRTVDALDRLAANVATNGEIVCDRFGTEKVNPAAVEARQLRIAYARLSAALRLPSGDESDPEAVRRPQRRSGARGVYSIGGSAS